MTTSGQKVENKSKMRKLNKIDEKLMDGFFFDGVAKLADGRSLGYVRIVLSEDSTKPALIHLLGMSSSRHSICGDKEQRDTLGKYVWYTVM